MAGKQCWLVGGGEGEEDENASESADQLGREGLGGRGLDANTSQTRPLSMCPSKTREAGRTKMIPLPVPNWASAEAQFIPNFSLHTKFFIGGPFGGPFEAKLIQNFSLSTNF